MRIFIASILQALVLTCSLMAQMPVTSMDPLKIELGKWWKNSQIVSKLHLSQAQIAQIEQSFLNHRLELANSNAELKRHEAELKRLMNSESINEDSIQTASEKIATERLALEKTYSSMMISIRKVLSGEQWRMLEAMRASKVFTVGNGVTMPKPIYRPLPKYTEEAKQARIEGLVVLKVIIRKDGTVDSFRIIQGLGYGLDESAIRTIAQEWRFIPGMREGEPVDVEATIETSFRLF
jgi:TonB family protein